MYKILIISLLLAFTNSFAQNSDLLYFVKNNNDKRVFDLLNEGADPNTADTNGYTALYYAITNGNVYITRQLLEHGANPDLPANDIFPLVEAVMYQDTAITYLLLDNGANPDVVDELFQVTPLMMSVSMDNYAISEILLYYGANPDKMVDDSTALIFAVKYSDTAMVNLLLNYGASPDLHSPKTLSPLNFAIKLGKYDIANLLIENGAKLNTDANDKNATINFAIKKYNIDLFKQLFPYYKNDVDTVFRTSLKYNFRRGARYIIKQNGKHYLMPYVSAFIIDCGTAITGNDILSRFKIGFHEARYDIDLKAGVSARPFASRDRIPYGDNTFLQVRDIRTVLSGELVKNFTFYQFDGLGTGMFLGGTWNYSVGRYAGLVMPIQHKYIFGGNAGLWIGSPLFRFEFGYEYLPIQYRHPNYFTCSFVFYIPFPY